MSKHSQRILVVGAGIAGASVAAHLAPHAHVTLLEQEAHAGYHTTGRSAALFSCNYGPSVIRALSRASGSFFQDPKSRFIASPLLKPRGLVFIARKDQQEAIEAARQELGSSVNMLAKKQALDLLPLLREEYLHTALYEEGSSDIDVDALLQHYLKTFKANEGELHFDSAVTGIEKTNSGWKLETRTANFTADIIINAAGAWADKVAQLAGVTSVGLVPKRRTALLVSPPDGVVVDHWPMAVDIDENFYMKPDAGKLLMSPADETPSSPCDSQPEDLDVAICVDRVQTAFDLQVRRIDHKWAGLRSFVADKCPVVGYDEKADGFFWLAGQGGYGIQSAPALSRLAASLVLRTTVPKDILDQGVDIEHLKPCRQTLLT